MADLGEKIIGAIRNVLDRCEEVGEKVGYPGEGGERRFRKWIASDLLEGVLGWPSRNVVVGERFDLLLLSEEDHALATIETKTPYHQASKKERRDFEERLSGFPTLRSAFFTNGQQWDRLDIVVSGAELQVLERSTFDVTKHSPAYAEQFFAPLQHRSGQDVPVGQVYKVNRDNAFISSTLARLTADLDDTVKEFTAIYRQMFYGLREGRAGDKARQVATAVYSQWCGKSLRVTPEIAIQNLQRLYAEEGYNHQTITKVLAALGLDGPGTPHVIEAILSLALPRKTDSEALRECLWPAFAASIDQLSAQTAHVVLARALLYRVGEDEKVFDRKLSGSTLIKNLDVSTSGITGRKFPATALLETLRSDMQGFLPTVYLRGEFDWWTVLPEQRAVLNPEQMAWLRPFDDELDRLNRLMLRRLSHYQFESVDVDIWRNIYENYLPADERQRLGGFYTPDELVSLVLDLAHYCSDEVGLCTLSYIDPACGSGAFVTTALARLLAHLNLNLPCHAHLIKKGEPAWKLSEKKLKLIGSAVHAIDLHPFASFLTTLNVLFMVLPLYAAAREKDPDFMVELHIFSTDGLEKPGKASEQQIHMFTQMNSRIQLTADSYDRYREIMDKKFDRVFGNPPWGGVLKGPLAPVYDTGKKKHFKLAFPNAAQGKYDIYGLFMERALQLLKAGGKVALLTQGTYLDKEWAKGIRKLLSTKSEIEYIVDLNPFGQLFFNAMNSPCITVTLNTAPNLDEECVCVISEPPKDFRNLNTHERRERVAATVREALGKVTKKSRGSVAFATAARVKRSQLKQQAADRWDLSGGAGKQEFASGWFNAAELFEIRQGVTSGVLDIFLMSSAKAKLLQLEKELVHKAIKTIQLKRWFAEWKDFRLLYPYHKGGKGSEPAFTIPWDDLQDQKLKDRLTKLGLEDALDFDIQVDARETEIVRNSGINNDSVKALLKHRISLGIVKYPKAAAYLVASYERLQGRVFKKKNIRDFNRRWYEYIWPRDPALMLSKPRILSPRLVRKLRFVLDEEGYLSDDAGLMIQPTSEKHRAWDDLKEKLAAITGKELDKKTLLQYCIAFMNSGYAQTRLVTGHRPTPKGSYAVTEAYMREIPIPAPSNKKLVADILSTVDALQAEATGIPNKEKLAILEGKLQELVNEALAAAPAPSPQPTLV